MKYTTNLQLKKPDYTDPADVQDFNDNMDTIDEKISSHEADIITPLYQNTVTTTNQINSIITEFCKQMKITKIEGLTVVNLLGTDGDCEDVGRWSQSNGTPSLDSSNKVIGSNSIKITSQTIGSCGVYLNIVSKSLDASKYYCVSAYLKNGNATNVYLMKYNGSNYTSLAGTTITDATKFNKVMYKFAGSENIQFLMVMLTSTASGQYAYVDGIMLEEITATQYADANFVPSPYVNGDYSVGESFTVIKTRGKNKLNLVQGSYGTSGNFVAYVKSLTHRDGVITAKPGTTYAVSLSSPLKYAVHEFDCNRNLLTTAVSWSASAVSSFTYTTGSNTRYIAIQFTIDDTTRMYAEDYQIQLEEGSVATAYEPCKEAYMKIPYPLRSVPSGTTDEITEGKWIKRIEKAALDGALSWSLFAHGTGFKRVVVSLSNIYGTSTSVLYKHNSKVLPVNGSGTTADSYMLFSNLDASFPNQLFITIPSADSGWADAYTPSVDELRAYFNGYKMYQLESGGSMTPYNGTGTKAWAKINQASPSVSGVDYSLTTCPTALCGNGYIPYRLYYQLATPVILEINQPNLVTFPTGDLVIESSSKSWVRPASITYQIAGSLKANIDEVMKGLSASRRLNHTYVVASRNFTSSIVIPNATDINIDSANVTVNTYGVYVAVIRATWGPNAISANRKAWILINGAGYDCSIVSAPDSYTEHFIVSVIGLAAGDKVGVRVWQNSGSSQPLAFANVTLCRVGDYVEMKEGD
ncbi:hypothetical protein [Clostridium magnum]|uniref:Uncharacterized protein n=1 Tax=Clostridium magnum DSM 2767 TaxID=1121326 RepID=A0A168E227_9CLOT|nr:hypothetical protein [Clostridium magnum]KZL93570.1 hypothetical protein CLMAG_06160 [Clostridium magnum DSM 2767]SHI59950.1 hypothetical protein SAMN02745944_04560 [Clostridium magnum DSM 2767]